MRVGRTRLPIPTTDYDQAWGNSLIRSLDQNFDSLTAGLDNLAATAGYYGSFFDTTTQTAAAIETPYPMQLNTTAESSQIAVVSGSRITFNNRGTYNVQFSAQIDQTSSSGHMVYIWLRKNGADVPNSASLVTIQGSNTELIAAWNFIVTVLSGDYVQIMWAVSDTRVQLAAFPATAFAPAIPSVIATAVSV
jgi:hypothetical protein